MSIKLPVSPSSFIFLLLSHVIFLSLSFPPGHRVTCSLSLSLSLSVSLLLSRLRSPRCRRSARRGRCCWHWAPLRHAGPRGALGARSGSGHEKRGSHLHSEDRRTTVTTAIMSLSFKFSDAEALLGRRPGRRPEEPKQGCEAPLRCEVSKQSCGKSQNAAGEPATHPPASHVDASHARWRGERQLEAARTRAKRVPVRFPWTARQVRLQV